VSEHEFEHAKESPWVITLPLVMLAIPSILFGAVYVSPLLFGEFFATSIFVMDEHDVLAHLAQGFHGAGSWGVVLGMLGHSVLTLPFWLALAGIFAAWYLYIKRPEIPGMIRSKMATVGFILDRKYGFDEFNEIVIAKPTRLFGKALWRGMDDRVIDGYIVNGIANTVRKIASKIRHVQSGYVYHYAFSMIIGLFLLMTWLAAR